MELKKVICKSGNEYFLVNEYWETSQSWGHKSTLLYNGCEYGTNKVRYYNRTWECYTYQSCMSGLIDDLLDKNLKSYIEQYKDINNISRLTSTKKMEIRAEWEQKEYTKDLMEIKERINGNYFNGD